MINKGNIYAPKREPMEYAFLKDISILFGLALVTVVLFRKLYFPSIIGFLVTGSWPAPMPLQSSIMPMMLSRWPRSA